MLDVDLKIADGTVQLTDGKIHYWAAGKGPPMVLLHAMGCSVKTWSRVLGQLAGKHLVYALVTMGQGDSDRPSREYIIGDYAGAVVSFMNDKGVKKATVVGNSVGAVIAAQIAASRPEMVDKLVLVGYPLRETEQERKDGLAVSKTRYDAKGIPLPRSLEDLKQHYVHIDTQLQKQVNDDLVKAGASAWKCMTAMSNFDMVPALKRIKAKTLLIFGEKDMLRSKEQALKNYIKGSELVIVPVAGHLPQMDNPEAFLAAVQSFLG